MIFKFNDEEKAIIKDFEARIRAEGITNDEFLHKVDLVIDQYGEGLGPNDEKKLEFLQKSEEKREAFYEEFKQIMRDFEEIRLKDLTTQTKIIANAKQIIEEAIIFHYNGIRRNLKGIENLINKPIAGIGVNSYERHYSCILSSGTNALFELANEVDNNPILLFDYDSCFKYLEESALTEHIKRLKGTPGEQELYTTLRKCLINSKYVYIESGNIEVPAEESKRIKRTAAKAKKAGAIIEGPKNLIIPTMNNYQYSMSLYQGGNAYLQPLSSMDNLKFDNGKLYFSDIRAREVSEAELRDLRTEKGIEELDLTNLRYYYSILFDQFQRSEFKVLQDIIQVGVPLLAGRKNPTEADVKSVISKIKSYHNVMGVIKNNRNGKSRESYYQVLNFEYYDEVHNTVGFSSPYMNYVIQKIYNLSVRRENGNPQLMRNGKPLTLPTHSYLIDSSIVKERNKAAVENVIILVALIEQAGNNEPHIKASTLIERNVQLADRLEVSVNPRALLSRVFKKTWELLRAKTRLEEIYTNIQLPDPKDPAYLPTMKNIDELVFKFPHEGKKN